MNCSFCNGDIPKGTGVAYIKHDGTITYFCANKCRKNKLKLRRNPRKLKWTGKSV